MTDDVHTLATGFGLVEAPRWHDGRLYFSDWDAHDVLALAPDGRTEVLAHVDSFPLCTDWLPDGRLLLVSVPDALLLRREPDGALVTHAELGGVAAGGWNDIVVDRHGNAYVDNVADAFTGGAPDAGLIALVGPDGATVRQVADGLSFPNGMALTRDGGTLIVAESYASRLTAYDIAADGSLSGRRVWAALDGGVPDGICVDAEDAVWYADVPHRRCVRVAEGGAVLRTVGFDRGAFACVLGGPDRRTLFVTAAEWGGPAAMVPAGTGRLLAVPVDVPGAGRP
ncbi:SMP-30/gluconolactonase/LRE family protein [Streptacidiphilus cavernicola]|uniref:SMP-30/gluconolactonase/LRE family protein n=1 Tax=Streptacidiphilus cavernicola TaxID=3342716 RepID=A0ABV6W3F6_9ACTN